MTEIELKSCWDVIRSAETFKDDKYLSFSNMARHLGSIKFEDKSDASQSALTDAFLNGNPTFKSTTDDHIIYLRQCIKNRDNIDQVVAWTEKLLRFCEIRLATLKTKVFEKCGTSRSAKLHGLMLGALFLDLYELTKDLRLLNIALKLADQKWVAERSTLMQRLTQRGADFQLNALELRVITKIEDSIGALENE